MNISDTQCNCESTCIHSVGKNNSPKLKFLYYPNINV